MPPRLSSTLLLRGPFGQCCVRFLRPQLYHNAAARCFRTISITKQIPGKNYPRPQRVPASTPVGSPCQWFQSRHLTSSTNMTFPSTDMSLEERLKLDTYDEPLFSDLSLEERLKLDKYEEQSFNDAIHGRKVPLELGMPKMRACIIRGIRHHDNFGTELRGYHQFDRALNARSIMSNRIPEMKEPAEFPYCIWYPDIATEATYREIAQRYPQMRYQVGRACAVAGYIELYHELDLLPDIAIAEEARDNQKNGRSLAIFTEIMAAPIRYAVMNDYERTVNLDHPRSGMDLNADTAVRSSLDWKHGYPYMFGSHPLDTVFYWNITEDCSFDAYDSELAESLEQSSAPDADLRLPLFFSPLPKNLPNINKDMLILEAAYSGNIDRYVRLRRPKPIWMHETSCVVRGIYHNTMFAKWWSLQPEILDQNYRFWHPHQEKIQAINARFIMNNNLSRITRETPKDHLPYLIYWPSVAHEKIYAELFHRQPSMKLQIARACIIGNYEELYRSMTVEPDKWLLIEARESPNPFFLKDQLEKGAENINDDGGYADWKDHHATSLMKSDLVNVFEFEASIPHLGKLPVEWMLDGIWNGEPADMTQAETYVGVTSQELYRE